MKKPIQISIPQPCHEKWADMAPADKGRFCVSCQKTVIDFTRSSDREIAQALRTDKHLCGRFMSSQLERDLVVPKEKSSLWAAASAAVLTFLTIGSNEASAQTQTPVSTEQTDKKTQPETFALTGVVIDEMGPLPGATVFNKNSGNSTETDIDGSFTIDATTGDIISFSFVDFDTQEITVSVRNKISVTLIETNSPKKNMVIVEGYINTKSIQDLANSQLRTITGVVSDENGPLPGASVLIRGTMVYTTTDIEGRYSIKATKGDILEYSFICEPYTVKVKNKDVINVKLPLQRTFFGRIFHSIGNWFR